MLAQAGPEERFLIGDALCLVLGPDREDVHSERSRGVAHVQVVVQWSGCQQQTSVLEVQLPRRYSDCSSLRQDVSGS